MFILFSKFKAHYKLAQEQGQIAPFLIAVLAVVIMAIMITVNIGKIGVIKTHVSNSGDAGALAGASMMATAFDHLVFLSSMMYANYYSYYVWVVNLYDLAEDDYETAINLYASAAASFVVAGGLAITACIDCNLADSYCASALVTCAACSGYGVTCGLCATYTTLCVTYTTLCTLFKALSAAAGAVGCAAGGEASKYWNSFYGRVYNMYNTIEDAWESQRDFYNQIRGIMIDWIAKAKDYASKYAMANAGMKDGQAEWTDGQGRKHSVAIDVAIQDIQSYELYTTRAPMSSMKHEWEDFDEYWMWGFVAFSVGVAGGCLGVVTVMSSPCTAIAMFMAGAAVIGGTILGVENNVWPHVKRMYKYFQPSCSTFSDGTDPGSEETEAKDEIFIAIRDVNRVVDPDRLVTVSSTQHHDGADLGLWHSTYTTSSGQDISGGATASFDSHNILLEMDCHSFGPGNVWGYADHDPHLISTQ